MDISYSTLPFKHWVLDGICLDYQAKYVLEHLPPEDSEKWVRYKNDVEQKRTHPMGGDLFVNLYSWPWLRFLERLTGVEDLIYDPKQYGGGIHVSDPGDFLNCHLDFSVNPQTGLERRLNCILYLNSCSGGETILYAPDGRTEAKRIVPQFNRMIVWEASDSSYHGAAPVGEGPPRVTVATYYYTLKRESTVTRTRALFAPRRGM